MDQGFVDPRSNPLPRADPRLPIDDPALVAELHRLCRTGHVYDVERWIKIGRPLQVNPKAVQSRGRTSSALEIALNTGNHSLALLLVANGYDLNLEPRCPLSRAIRARRWDFVDLLLAWGADPHRVDLGDLFDSYNSELWERFRELGVELTAGYELAYALGYHTSNKPLFGWAKRHRERNPRVQKALNMALGHHTSEGNEKGVQLTLWAGADPHAPAPELRFPDLADDEDHEVDPEDRYLGTSAIHEACARGHVELLQRLGPDPAIDDFDDLYQVAASVRIIEFLATLAPPSKVGTIVTRQVYWMEEQRIGHARSSENLRALFRTGARWLTSTSDEIANVRRSLLKMSAWTFEGAMKLLATGDHCTPEILHALGRTKSIRARMRQAGFLSSPGVDPSRYVHRPTRSREVVAKFGAEPKVRKATEEPRLPRAIRIGHWRPGAQETQLDRATLFERVWSEPVERLAKTWGLSDRGLAKACARLKVPVPPRGYWARLQHGYATRRPRLPELRPGEAEEVVILLPPSSSPR